MQSGFRLALRGGPPTSRRPLFSLFLAVVLTLSVLGVSPVTANAAAFAVTIQSVLGLQIIRLLHPKLDFSIIGLIGPGLTVGAALWIMAVQLLGGGQGTNLAVAGLGLVVSIVLSRNLSAKSPSSNQEHLLVTLGLALVIMSNEWKFMAVAGLALLLVYHLGKIHSPSPGLALVAKSLLLLGVILSLIWGQNRQGRYWWIVTDDYSYFEALQFHLREFGIWDSWGPTNISLYHWLTPAWIGQTSQVALAADWIVLTRVAPLVFSMSIAASTLLLLKQLLHGSKRTELKVGSIWGCFYLFLVLRIDLSGPSTYAVFAFAATTVLLLLKQIEDRTSIGGRLLLIVMIIATTFAKLFSLPVALCVMAIIASLQWSRSERSRHFAVWATGLSGVLIFLGFLIMSGPALGNGIKDSWTIRTLEIADLIHLLAPVIGPSMIPLSLGLAVTWFARAESNRVRLVMGVGLISTCLALMSKLLIAPGFAIDSDNYFFKPALYFALLIPVAALAQNRPGPQNRVALIGSALSVIATSEFKVLAKVIDQVPKDLAGRLHLEYFVTQTWLAPVAAALGFTGVYLLIKRFRALRSYSYFFLLTVVASVASVEMVDRIDDSIRVNQTLWTDRNSSTVISVLGNPDLVSVGQWIEENTAKDSIIATNDICAENQTKEVSASATGNFACESMGNDYTLGHTAKRQFLLLGPRFAYQNPDKRDEYSFLSLAFGRKPSIETLSTLRNSGVDYFVLKGSQVVSELRALGLTTSYEAGNYAVVNLRIDPQSREAGAP